jgi:NitT/TauT family transport system substrate-binding protein
VHGLFVREEVLMRAPQAEGWTRRAFLGGLALTGTAGLLGRRPGPAAAEPPPETTTLRLAQADAICLAPQYVAEELLRGEGFTEVQYKKPEEPRNVSLRMKALAAGEVDIDTTFAATLITRIDVGDPIVALAGGHIGCLELFGTDRIRAIRDLKDKTVEVYELGGVFHLFLASMVAYVGLDPRTDIHWVAHPWAEAMQLFAEGKTDALLISPPRTQELRAKQIGHVVLNSSVDRPWSQYFCCMVAGNRAFVQKHPVATKRALRAILKAADVCALEPERAAQFLVDRDYVSRYDYALQTMKDIPYGRWREYVPEDTLRFYALRLHEAGMIKSSPQKIIAQGTYWRFLNELKKELKG